MQLIHLSEVDSTSAFLGGEAREFPPWTVVLADRQRKGRGQQGRTWHSPAGGLYASVLLGPEVVSPVFTLLGGVAVLEACRAISGSAEIGLKWVNDLVFDRRKLGGLLAEVVHRKRLILGIGINLAPVDLPDAACLWQIAGREVDRLALLEEIVARLECWVTRWGDGGARPVIAAWSAHSVTLGREVRVETAGETLTGTATTLDEEGRLVLELPDGRRRQIASGTVRLADGRYA